MVAFGTCAILLGTLASVWAAAASFLGGALRARGFIESGRRAVYATGLFLSLAVFALEYLIHTNDFSVQYVFQNSHRDQPFFYKIAALWGGQAGSLLFWAWLLSCYAVVLTFWNRDRHRELMPFVTGVLMATATFFGLMLSIVTPPFVPGDPQANGMGMNPLLQNFWMVIHPPCLYLGYVGFAVPFAFGVAALLTRRTGEVWIRTTRRWTIFSWFFLGIGILLGGYWAYIELGWGGYWAWDPVETASFMPWLTGTAFLHSVMIQEQKRMLKVWNLLLVILTYCLAIFGTFLTRSGILQSVHAFAGTGLGPYFATFLSIAFFGSLGLLIWRLPDLRSEHRLDSLVSRESAFLLNNLLLVGIAAAVFFLTTFPIPSELWTGKGITMGPPIYNRVTIPWFLVLIVLTGIGPAIAWRKASLASLRRSFLGPAVGGVATMALLFIAGVHEFYALAFYGASIFVIGTIVSEFRRGAQARMATAGEALPTALGRLVWRNKRRYGGYIVHLGVIFAVIGIAGSSAHRKEYTYEDVRPGAVMQADGYEIKYERIETGEGAAYSRLTQYTRLSRGGRDLGPLTVEKRVYKDVKNPTTEVAIHPILIPPSLADLKRIGEDVYLTPLSVDPETGLASFKIFVLPFVNWLWFGGLVVILGTHLAILPDRRERRLLALARAVEQRATA